MHVVLFYLYLKASSVVDDFIRRVFVICFADSVHTIHKTTPQKLIDFCQKVSIVLVSLDVASYKT